MIANVSQQPQIAHASENYLTATKGIRSWLFTLDHKRIGVMYLVGVTVALFLVGTTRRFKRHEEVAVVYRFGRTTSQERICGTWTAYPHQYEFGDHVYVTVLPIIERVVRVRGETARAWLDLQRSLPLDVAVDRPALDVSRRMWVVRAHGWVWDANPPRSIDLEGSGLTETTALDDLSARLSDLHLRGR